MSLKAEPTGNPASRNEDAGRKLTRGCATRRVRALRTPQALQLPVCVRPARRAFSAGIAPTCLQRDLHRQSARSRKLAAGCAWVEKPLPYPRLLQKPIFGNCLEDVLQSARPAIRPESEQMPQKADLPQFPQTPSRPIQGRHAPGRGTRPQTPRPQPRPGKPPRTSYPARPDPVPYARAAQASLAMLTRRARDFIAPQKSPPRTAPRVPPVPRVFPQAINLPISISPHTGLPTGWMARLGPRLARRLGWGGVSPAGEPSPPGVVIRESVDSSGRIPDWVAHAAALELVGPAAPLKLLLRLIGEEDASFDSHPARNAPVAQEGQEGASARSPLLRSQAERALPAPPAWDAPFASTPRGKAPTPVPQPPTGAQQGFYPQSGSLPLPAAGQPYFRPPLAPPLAAGHPPTLLPPQAVFDAPTPIASAAARQAAKHDEANLAEEDLDVLASKIKRILDDEARRYGIQV